MVKPTCLTLKVVALLLAGFYFSACTGGAASSSFGSTSTSSNGSSIIDIPPGMSNGISDNTLLFVGIDSSKNSIVHVHKDGEFDTPCAIRPSDTLKDIKCLVEIPEGELYNKGLTFTYNVPPGMCRFLRRKTYWYYNNQVGYGPKVMTVNRVLTDGNLVSSTCTVDGITQASCQFLEVVIDPNTLKLSCVYASKNSSGCFGKYSLTVNDTIHTTSPPSTTATSTTTLSNWGGSIQTVLGGAGRNSGWQFDSLGFPKTIEYETSLGALLQTYQIPAPITSINELANDEIANYWTPALHTHQGFGVGSRTTDFPYFIDPVDDLNGSSIPITVTQNDLIDGNILRKSQDSYEYECLDQAYEVLHRIKVYVREWNAYQDFSNYISSKGVTVNPDRTGPENTTNCMGVSDLCNDVFDIDDLITQILGAPYDTSQTQGAYDKRIYYFPNLTPK